MITTANFYLRAHLGGEVYLFEYYVDDLWQAIEEFWREDYPEVLAEKKDSGVFPFEVYSMCDGNELDIYHYTFNVAVFHAYFDHGHKADGPYTLDEFDADIIRKVKSYGMTIQQVCDRIAEFTGDKKKEAMRKAKIFRHNCRVPLTKVTDIRLAFGRYSDEHGNYYGENRDTLHFYYRDSEGENYAFSIMD